MIPCDTKDYPVALARDEPEEGQGECPSNNMESDGLTRTFEPNARL